MASCRRCHRDLPDHASACAACGAAVEAGPPAPAPSPSPSPPGELPRGDPFIGKVVSDVQNVHVEHTISDLARLVRQTLSREEGRPP